MSAIVRMIKILLLISFLEVSAQNQKKTITLYIDLSDKLIEKYSIKKDTTSASFSFYLKMYENRTEREKSIKKYNYLRKHPNEIVGDPDKVVIPDFTTTLYVINRKPEKLNALNNIKFITLRKFVNDNSKTTSPTYIIHKLKNGSYLKWETYTLD